MRGGFGKAGRFRHKKSYMIRHGLSIGKKGFTSINKKKGLEPETLNLSQLSEIVDKRVSAKEATAEAKSGKVEVDLNQLGFKKLLGMGSINYPVLVKVDKCSESALSKIKEAGGEVLLSNPAK